MGESSLDLNIRQIIISGLLTLLIVTSAALLHTNQPEFILDRFVGISSFEYSLFDAVLYLSYLIFGIITGIISDRLARRKLFVILGGFGATVFYWLMTTTLDYRILLLMRFAQGAFTVLAWQTLMTLALDNSTPDNRGRNMGFFGAFLAMAMGLGPALGGIISEAGVFQPYYAASILSLFVVVFGSVAIKEPSTLKARPSIQDSIILARRCPQISIPAAVNFVDRLHMGFILTALPLLLVQVLSVSESLRGVVLALFAAPFIILQYPMGRLSDRIGRYRLVIFGSISYGVVLAFVGLVSQFGLSSLIISLVFLGIFSGVTAPATLAWVGDAVKPEDTATGMGFFNLLGNIGMVTGSALLGLTLLITDFVGAFIIAAVVEVISIIVLIMGVRKFSERGEMCIIEREDEEHLTR